MEEEKIGRRGGEGLMDMMEKVRLINEAMEHVDSRYRLSVILFKRARAINQGDQPWLLQSPKRSILLP